MNPYAVGFKLLVIMLKRNIITCKSRNKRLGANCRMLGHSACRGQFEAPSKRNQLYLSSSPAGFSSFYPRNFNSNHRKRYLRCVERERERESPWHLNQGKTLMEMWGQEAHEGESSSIVDSSEPLNASSGSTPSCSGTARGRGEKEREMMMV